MKKFCTFANKMIELLNLTIGYKSKSNGKVVAGPITASIHSGELTCLLGQNGIGKSTLLRTLSAFQPPLGGEIRIEGRKTSTFSGDPKEFSRLIGVVLTERPDLQNMTARELVELGRSPYTGFWGRLRAEDHQVVEESLALVGIQSLAARAVHTLSDGERQKVMIAKALAQQTPIIFLDEPTAFLDFPSKVETMQLLSRLAHEQQKTIFLSSHDVELALQLSDRLWLMEPGRLSTGTPRELADDGTLSRFIERDGTTFDPQNMTICAYDTRTSE